MEGAVRCNFDCMTYFLENEKCCYVTPIDKPDKIMKQFGTSYEMIRFLKEKGFLYNPITFE